MLTYSEICRELEEKQTLTSLTEEEKIEWGKVLQQQETEMLDHAEELAMVRYHQILFSLKTRKTVNQKEIQEQFFQLTASFLQAEKELQEQQKLKQDEDSAKRILNQFTFFYKLAQFYYASLEKEFTQKDLMELADSARIEKLRLLQKQELTEGNISKYLQVGRLAIIASLRKHIFLYSFLSAIGIVLLWQGVWGIIDWTIGLVGASDYLFPYLITTGMGVTLLYFLGLFVSLTAGVESSDGSESDQLKEVKHMNHILSRKEEKRAQTTDPIKIPDPQLARKS